jgi:L-threonylcarbamoyladenylate synthase
VKSNLVKDAIGVLNEGGVIAHPTEAVFGIAARGECLSAVERVSRIKARPSGKNYIVLMSELSQAEDWVFVDTPYEKQIKQSWPGPVTWVLPAKDAAPNWLRDGEGRIAVRVTAHDLSAALCRSCGPIISTSANCSGDEPLRNISDVVQVFGGKVDFFLEGKLGGAGRPSLIYDGLNGQLLRS